MKRIFARHWSYVPTGIALAVLLILFWFFNQSYLTQGQNAIALFLENPILTFGLIILGAYVGASLSGEFGIRMPMTYEPLVLALTGGFIVGVGAVVAEMSVHSTVLFNLAGVFTLPAFMITKGWIYGVFMILGGLAASKLLVLIIVKTASLKRELTVPKILKSRRNHRIAFHTLAALLALTVIVVMVFPPMAYSERIGLALAMLLLFMFGLVTERGTICMSSMLKEWFISHSSYVWRSVLFTIMCLALLYQAGLRLALYEPIELESYVSNPLLLALGSILMGLGFVFADGCFIGSLWKAGQGNVINMVGIIGLMMGIGASRIGAAMIGKPTNLAGSLIPNQLSSVINPVLFLIVLWTAGIVLLTVFRQKRYRY
jgi:hypothetical protein